MKGCRSFVSNPKFEINLNWSLTHITVEGQISSTLLVWIFDLVAPQVLM